MSVSVHVEGIRDLDGKFKDMVDLKKLCDKQKMSYPKELVAYFAAAIDEHGTDDLEDLSEKSMKKIMATVSLYELMKGNSDHYDYDSGEGGAIIQVKDIPSDVKAIRVYLS